MQQKGTEAIKYNKIIIADEIYAHALKYTRTASERELFTALRYQIAPLVSPAQDEQNKERIKDKKREKWSDFADKLVELFSNIMVVLFFASIVSTIVFGTLWLAGVYKLSKVFFFISCGILLCYIPILLKEIRK